MKPPPELSRAREVVRALQRLGDDALDPNLDPGLARRCLDLARAPLTVEALALEASRARGRQPLESVGIVVAQGVFTAPLEWAALYATMGLRVLLKAPREQAETCRALAEAMRAEGLPVQVSTGRDLSGLEALVAFGGEQTAVELAQGWPQAKLQSFGHRVSAAWVQVPEAPEAIAALGQALAWDHLLYDGQGCMAPVAVFVEGDRLALADALHLALSEAPWPRAPLDPALGPLWRERLGLARALGQARTGAQHAVLLLPADQLLALALPRMAVLLPAVPDALLSLPLSTLALNAVDAPPQHHAPRTCLPGQMQLPPFPRRHDGVDMVECVLADPPARMD